MTTDDSDEGALARTLAGNDQMALTLLAFVIHRLGPIKFRASDFIEVAGRGMILRSEGGDLYRAELVSLQEAMDAAEDYKRQLSEAKTPRDKRKLN